MVGIDDGGLAFESGRHGPELDRHLARIGRLAGLGEKLRARHAGHDLGYVLEKVPDATGGLVDTERRFDVRHGVVLRGCCVLKLGEVVTGRNLSQAAYCGLMIA